MLVYGHDEELAEWLGLQLGITFAPPYVAIGVMRRDELVAAVLYNSYEPPNIQVTFATTTPRWASRQVIARLLAYPFCELGCRRISAVTRAGNHTARAFLQRLGFLPEGFHPQYFHDDDAVSYGLLKRDAQKWIEDYHVKSTDPTGSTRPLHDGEGGVSGEHSERHRQCEAG